MMPKPNQKRKKYKAPASILLDIAEKTGFSFEYVKAIAKGYYHNESIEQELAPYEVKITVSPKTLERLAKLKEQNSKAKGYGLGRGGRPKKNKTDNQNS